MNYSFENSASYKIIDHLYDKHKDFVILGLCGRVGSGVSTVSGILEKRFEELQLPDPGFDTSDLYSAHEYRILYTYAKENWNPFFKIRTSALITRHILRGKNRSDCVNKFVDFLLKLCERPELKDKFEETAQKFFEKNMELSKDTINLFKFNKSKLSRIFEDNKEYTDGVELQIKQKVCTIKFSSPNEEIMFEYNKAGDGILFKNVEISKLVDIYQKLRQNKSGFKNPVWYILLKQYLYDFLPQAATELWDEIRDYEKNLPTQALQCLGNNLRLTKEPFFGHEFREDAYVCLAADVNLAIKTLRAYQFKMEEIKNSESSNTSGNEEQKGKSEDQKRTLIVIDSIKNPYESFYLKTRYNNYYLIGVYTEDSERRKRLRECEHLTDENIKDLDIIEQNAEFKKKIKEYEKLNHEKKKLEKKQKDVTDIKKRIGENIPLIIAKMYEEYEHAGLLDSLPYISPFVLQNVSSCLESADILINNRSDNKSYAYLKKTLLRYVSLILNPGIVLPTAVERCMQIAHTAKLNSGCISRQVGAVLTDRDYHLLSIGWNQQPESQLPCSYRELCESYHHWSCESYSDYENDDNEAYQVGIKEQVEKIFDCEDSPLKKKGKLPRYCFKDYYNSIDKGRNQVHTRALHAEETAFLNVGANKEHVKNGILFTTSSPCELCSKKAMYLGVSKIYYIQPYPGVSEKHVLSMGERKKRPDLILFTGAIGTAYTKLFAPLIAQKDENEMWLGAKMDIALLESLEKINSNKIKKEESPGTGETYEKDNEQTEDKEKGQK